MPAASPHADWTAFDAAAAGDADARIVDQFAADPARLERMSVEAAGLYLDLSKQSWTRSAFEACLELGRTAGVEAARDRLFGGEAINSTEGRAVLHPFEDQRGLRLAGRPTRAVPGADPGARSRSRD